MEEKGNKHEIEGCAIKKNGQNEKHVLAQPHIVSPKTYTYTPLKLA